MTLDPVELSFAALIALCVFHVVWAVLCPAEDEDGAQHAAPIASRRFVRHRARRSA